MVIHTIIKSRKSQVSWEMNKMLEGKISPIVEGGSLEEASARSSAGEVSRDTQWWGEGPVGGRRRVECLGGCLQETSYGLVCRSPERVQEELSWEGRLQIHCGGWSCQLRGFKGFKCFSHVLWPFVFRNVNLQKEMAKFSYCIIHKACCLLKLSPPESSSIPQEIYQSL